MEWREYQLKAEGYSKKLERELESRWEEIRIITYPICVRLESLGGQKRLTPFDRWMNDKKGNSQLERLKKKVEAHKQKHGNRTIAN